MDDVTKATVNNQVVLKPNGKDIRFELAAHPLDKHGIPYETEVYDAMARFVEPGDFVVDGGANVGMCSLVLSHLVGRGGVVLAIEPDPANCVALHANIELNDCHNISCIHNALWSTDCFKDFHPMQNFSASSGFFPYEISFPPVNILARCLDTLLTSSRLLSNPRLIKLDCEGAEEQILKGAGKILKAGVDCLIVEFSFPIMDHIGTTESSIRGYMNDLGYDCFVLAPGFRPTFIAPHLKMSPLGGGDGHFNIMFANRDRVRELWRDSDLTTMGTL